MMRIIKALSVLFVFVIGGLLLFGGTGSGPDVAANTVHAVSSGQAIYGITQAVHGSPGTRIYSLNNLWTFIWTLRDANGVAWVTVDTAKYDVLHNVLGNGGSMVSVQTMKGLEDQLIELGWRVGKSSEVPDSVRIGLKSIAEASSLVGGRAGWLTYLSGIRPTFVLMFEDTVWVDQFIYPSSGEY